MNNRQPVLDPPPTAPTISREQFFQPRLSHNATSKVTSVVTYSESKTETVIKNDGQDKVALSQLCNSIAESTDNVITVNRQRKVSAKTNAKDILSQLCNSIAELMENQILNTYKKDHSSPLPMAAAAKYVTELLPKVSKDRSQILDMSNNNEQNKTFHMLFQNGEMNFCIPCYDLWDEKMPPNKHVHSIGGQCLYLIFWELISPILK